MQVKNGDEKITKLPATTIPWIILCYFDPKKRKLVFFLFVMLRSNFDFIDKLIAITTSKTDELGLKSAGNG